MTGSGIRGEGSPKKDEGSPKKDGGSPKKDGASSKKGRGLPRKTTPLPNGRGSPQGERLLSHRLARRVGAERGDALALGEKLPQAGRFSRLLTSIQNWVYSTFALTNSGEVPRAEVGH
jgi:hypothetical protein